MTYFSDLPLPDLTLREGDVDPVDFTLKQQDNVTPVDLTGKIVELRLRAFRGEQAAKTFSSSGSTPAILVSSPTLGAIRFTQPTTPASSVLLAADDRYRGYFAIYDSPTSGPKTVPQPRDFWVAMLPKVT